MGKNGLNSSAFHACRVSRNFLNGLLCLSCSLLVPPYRRIRLILGPRDLQYLLYPSLLVGRRTVAVQLVFLSAVLPSTHAF